MKQFHVIYTDQTGIINSEVKEFDDFISCEDWLKSINAKYWEIGVDDFYQPFGEQWKEEMMKISKIEIINMYRCVCLEYDELQQAYRKLKEKL